MATKKNAPKKVQTLHATSQAKAIVNKQLNLQYDPKNREVYLFQIGTKYQVTKPGTLFTSELLNEDDATIEFQFQIGCSQN